jgi:hypothetical protein
MWRMAAGLAALPVLSYWAMNLQVFGSALQVDGSLIGLAVGSQISGLLFLSGFRARRRANKGDWGLVSSHMFPALVIERAA